MYMQWISLPCHQQRPNQQRVELQRFISGISMVVVEWDTQIRRPLKRRGEVPRSRGLSTVARQPLSRPTVGGSPNPLRRPSRWNNDERRWFCKCSNLCTFSVSTKSGKKHGSYSHGIEHLRNQHGIVSRRSFKQGLKKEKLRSQSERLMASELFQQNKAKAWQYIVAVDVIENMKSLASVESRSENSGRKR